jgi:hypothetical protein
MSLGIFLFGVFVTGIVATACWLVATGIRDEHRDRKRFEAEHESQLAAGHRRRMATREDGRTVEAERRSR